MNFAAATFTLKDSFIEEFAGKQPEWGPVGYVTYRRTYSRNLESIKPRHQELAAKYKLKHSEEFWLTLIRVIEGTYKIQEAHCKTLRLPWNPKKAQKSAQEMYRLMWEFKFLPPGRGLWMMGTDYVESRGSACLNNCGFISSADLKTSFSNPFCFLMDMSMLGVGIGGDTKGAGTVLIKEPKISKDSHVVSDTREGWISVVRRYLDAYVGLDTIPEQIDFSQVRGAGQPIKGFGGVSSGPEPLKDLLKNIQDTLKPLVGELITSTAIVDLFNLIGRCVVSGNVRRSAEILFGEIEDEDFLKLKDPNLYPKELAHHRWASNNSIFAKVGMDYSKVSELVIKNGEPGFQWLDTARAYSRLIDPIDWKDIEASGSNPCQPSDATILTLSGISTIGKIEIGDKVWTGSRFSKVKNKVHTGKKEVWKYFTKVGIFIGTENHRVLEFGVKKEVKSAEFIDISVGPKLSYKYNSKNLTNADLVNIMDGLILGDGTVHKASNNKVLLIIGEKDKDYFADPIKELLGKHKPGICQGYYETKTTIQPEELPHTYKREIPKRYLFGKDKETALFLRGLYSANGSVIDKRITLKSTSLNLIFDVQQMLSSIGIRSYYTVNLAHPVKFKNGTYQCKESYDLNISVDRDIFRDSIGFIHQYKQEKLNAICDNMHISIFAHSSPKQTYPIYKRELRGIEDVYDITVEAEEHTYWTQGLHVSNCNEQTLFSYEVCNLVESFPSRHSSYEEFERTLKFAYLYAKTVTLVPTHDERTNAVMMRNRRIGTSQSGIVQAFKKHGRRNIFQWCDKGYKYLKELDKQYSQWMCIPESIKKTSVKPSGSISLLPGVTPGIHYPHSEYYFRVIRFATDSLILEKLRKANYTCIDLDPEREPNTTAVYFAVKEEYFDRSKADVTMWEQLENAAQYQTWWADNQVSCTVTFSKEEAKSLAQALELYETRLKGISFLPLEDHGYEHAPYQAISKEEYEEYIKNLKKLNLNSTSSEVIERFCDGDTCIVK